MMGGGARGRRVVLREAQRARSWSGGALGQVVALTPVLVLVVRSHFVVSGLVVVASVSADALHSVGDARLYIIDIRS